MQLDKARVLPIIKAALKEDIGNGDITTTALVEKTAGSKAVIIAKEDCVVCGLKVAEWIMAQVDFSVRFKPNCDDGHLLGGGKELAYLEGHTASILRAERTMINFLSFLSAIATTTRTFVEKAGPYSVKIMDTRKTLPLLRYLEKYAVFTGGGTNHRMGLYDQVLIKDNHIAPFKSQSGFSLKKMVETARKRSLKGAKIEIEVSSVEEFNDALAGKPDIIMLDNMAPQSVRSCVEIRRLSRIKPSIEVSGGINPDTIEEFVKMKPDAISIGALTASVRSIDMSLEII
ncbi:MAG: carboxylating nicotinate-nucleotide diphosphorylase [Candidatus Omnitrophica bacterium]|nr:carboxylating nicotinate-nucleotide diphosphorylase [Candidatus Omnitrophota bacterium]